MEMAAIHVGRTFALRKAAPHPSRKPRARVKVIQKLPEKKRIKIRYVDPPTEGLEECRSALGAELLPLGHQVAISALHRGSASHRNPGA